MSIGLAGFLAGILPSFECQAQSLAGSVGGGIGFESYRFASEEAVGLRGVSLVTLPFSAGVDLRRGVRLRVRGAFAEGSLSRADGTSATISGLTDTEVQVEATLGSERVRIAGIVELPTGHSNYTREEVDVAGVITSDVLPFEFRNWGSGGAVGLYTGVSHQVAEFGVGASASYLLGREFEVFAGEDASYRPGDQFVLGVAVDRTVARAGKAALRLQMIRYGDDELAGSNLYRSGTRYQAMASYAFAAPGYSSALVYAGGMYRSEGAFLALSDNVASQNLVRVGGVMRTPFGWGTLVPSVDLRVLRSGDGVGQGYSAGLRISAERQVGRSTLMPTLQARFGRVVVFDEARSGFTGLDLGLSAHIGGSGS